MTTMHDSSPGMLGGHRTYYDAVMGAQRHLMHDGVPLYAFHYDAHTHDRGWYPRGCLARFRVTTDGVEDVTP